MYLKPMAALAAVHSKTVVLLLFLFFNVGLMMCWIYWMGHAFLAWPLKSYQNNFGKKVNEFRKGKLSASEKKSMNDFVDYC